MDTSATPAHLHPLELKNVLKTHIVLRVHRRRAPTVIILQTQVYDLLENVKLVPQEKFVPLILLVL